MSGPQMSWMSARNRLIRLSASSSSGFDSGDLAIEALSAFTFAFNLVRIGRSSIFFGFGGRFFFPRVLGRLVVRPGFFDTKVSSEKVQGVYNDRVPPRHGQDRGNPRLDKIF
jgi:hypothetical protein